MSAPSVTITSNDERMDGGSEVLSVDILSEVDRIPEARVVLIDGDSAGRKFAISDSSFFEPGRVLEIKLRNEGEVDNPTVFRGPVVRHAAEVGVAGSVLVVEAKDAAI